MIFCLNWGAESEYENYLDYIFYFSKKSNII